MKIRSLGMVSVSAAALAAAGIPQVSRAAAPAPVSDAETLIVTGTRDAGVKAIESAAPIEVIGAESLEATGANNVLDALKDVLPSFSSSAFVGDSSELVRTARLRGMSPGETLILVDGKRRHTSANIVADQSPDVGSNPADLDMIPLSLIDHVEVLLDGAAAQYGSDAVAGVINIILKKATSGTMVTAGGGITTRGDGAQGSGGALQAFDLGNGGFVDISADYRHQDFMNRNGINSRTVGQTNVITGAFIGGVRNRIEGTPLSDLSNLGINFEQPLSDDLTVYGFGTFGRRSAQAYENNREAARAPYYWPLGFFPRETLNEVDGAVTGGIKGTLFGKWDWDLSATWGRDHDELGLINSYNTGMSNPPTYAAHAGAGLNTSFTGGTLGGEENTQTTVNLDVRRGFDVGFLASPLNFAFGGEFRYETYGLTAGDPGTYLYGGTQSEAGLTPTDATNVDRNVEAVYADLSTHPIDKWLVDVAGRFESYSEAGVGSTTNGKFTTRYDFTDKLALRGTVSTGFHAPNLAQTNFAATAVTPNSLTLQAPPGSPAGVFLGAPPLKPETSQNLSFGIVTSPTKDLDVTLDAYQIYLKNQIINSGQLSGAAAVQAAALNGNIIPANLLATTSAYVTFFTNGASTRTRGIDLSADYKNDLGAWGRIKWTLAGNINNIAITDVNPRANFNQQVSTDLTKGAPANKVSLAGNWHISNFDVTLRETRYGHADENNGSSSAVTPFSNIYIKSAYITDLDVSYYLTDGIKLNVGGNNIFDHMSSELPSVLRQGRDSNLYAYYTPWGIAGAYFYSRITANF